MKAFLIAACALWALCVPTATASAHYNRISPYVEPVELTDWRWQRLYNRPTARWIAGQKAVARWYVTRPHTRSHSWHWGYAGYWW